MRLFPFEAERGNTSTATSPTATCRQLTSRTAPIVRWFDPRRVWVARDEGRDGPAGPGAETRLGRCPVRSHREAQEAVSGTGPTCRVECGSGIRHKERVEPSGRSAPGTVRDCLAPRRRRHGRSLARARHPPRSRGRDQGAAGRARAGRAVPEALRPRSEGDLVAQPSEHLHLVRRGRSRSERRSLGAPLPGHGVPRGRSSRRSPAEGSAPASRRSEVRPADRFGPRRGTPSRHHSPRSQARQRHAHAVGREAARLRAGEDGRGGGGSDRRAHEPGHRGQAPDRARNDPRHVPVHVARAARGAGSGRPHRHLRASAWQRLDVWLDVACV